MAILAGRTCPCVCRCLGPPGPLRLAAPQQSRTLVTLPAPSTVPRGWYFHKELQAWLTMVPGTDPTQKTDRCVAGSGKGALLPGCPRQGLRADKPARGTVDPGPEVDALRGARASPPPIRPTALTGEPLPSLSLTPTAPPPPTHTLPVKSRFERGAFFVFEPATWEVTRKDNFVVHFEHLERAPPLPGRPQPGLQARA